jgi:fumarate reductase (CoM/CoB) subunit A
VIMTTGGMGAMFPQTDNVALTTGEAYAYAFNAGAEMIGMEFCHFLPTPIFPEKMKVHKPFIGMVNGLINEGGARLYNGLGERFMLRQFPDTKETKRNAEELTRAIGLEICEGRGGKNGGVYLDLSDVPDDVFKLERYDLIRKLADRGGINLRTQAIELVPNPHDLVGGIKIDEKSRTNVDGLYASGEASGGSHGASRFGGSALADAMVFGEIGAFGAVEYAEQLGGQPEPDDGELERAEEQIDAWLSQPDGLDPMEAKRQVKQLAFKRISVVRSGDGDIKTHTEDPVTIDVDFSDEIREIMVTMPKPSEDYHVSE